LALKLRAVLIYWQTHNYLLIYNLLSALNVFSLFGNFSSRQDKGKRHEIVVSLNLTQILIIYDDEI